MNCGLGEALYGAAQCQSSVGRACIPPTLRHLEIAAGLLAFATKLISGLAGAILANVGQEIPNIGRVVMLNRGLFGIP